MEYAFNSESSFSLLVQKGKPTNRQYGFSFFLVKSHIYDKCLWVCRMIVLMLIINAVQNWLISLRCEGFNEYCFVLPLKVVPQPGSQKSAFFFNSVVNSCFFITLNSKFGVKNVVKCWFKVVIFFKSFFPEKTVCLSILYASGMSLEVTKYAYFLPRIHFFFSWA